MFEHSGRKLKTFAISLFWIFSITISGLWLYGYIKKIDLYWDILEDASTEFAFQVVFMPILEYVFIILLMVLFALVMCSIGETASKSAENAYYTRMILEKMNDSGKTPGYVPDVIANSVSEQSPVPVPETFTEPEPEPEPAVIPEAVQPATAENTSEVSAKFCIICGKKVPSTAVFCPDCGNKF